MAAEEEKKTSNAGAPAPHKAAKKAPKKVVVSVARKGAMTDADDGENVAKARKGAIFLAFVVLAYVVYLILSGQMSTFLEALSGVEVYWVWASVFCYVLYFFFGIIAYVIAVLLDHDSPVGVRDLMSVEASGVFFGNLTPMQAGAVPSQIVRLTRTGLDPGEASATQFTRFIMFQFGVVLFAALMLLAKFKFFLETYGNIVFLNLVVFGVHFLELVVLFVVCLCPGFVKRIGNWFLHLCNRHGWIKETTAANWNDVINVQVDEFSHAFKRAAKDLPSMGLTLFVTMLQLASLYAIPWFVLRAFGVEGDFLECLAAGSMVQMVATAVPLPGGTGGAEGGFALFYGPLFGSSSTAGYLIWRLVTFIGPTILAAPLLGLRSRSTVSLYHRWNRLINRGSAARSAATVKLGGTKRAKTAAPARQGGGVSVNLSKVKARAQAPAEKPVQPTQPAQKAAAGEKPGTSQTSK